MTKETLIYLWAGQRVSNRGCLSNTQGWGGNGRSGAYECAAEVILRIGVMTGKTRTSQPKDRFDLLCGYPLSQQLSGYPQIHNAPVRLGKALQNLPVLYPALIDRRCRGGGECGNGSRPARAGSQASITIHRVCRHNPHSFRVQQVTGKAGQTRTGMQNFYPGCVASHPALWFLIGESSQSSQVAPVGTSRVTSISTGQLFADGCGRCGLQRRRTNMNPRLQVTGARAEQHTGIMSMDTHGFQNLRIRVVQINQDVTGVLAIGVGLDIHIPSFAVTQAKKSNHRATHQLIGRPKAISWKGFLGAVANQTDRVQIARHRRKLASDCLHRNKKSTVDHGARMPLKPLAIQSIFSKWKILP